MSENFNITLSNPDCEHHEYCGCRVTIEGKSIQTMSVKYTSDKTSLTDQYIDIICRLHPWTPNKDMKTNGITEEQYVRSQIPKGGVLRLIKPPFKLQPVWPQETQAYPPDREVEECVKLADLSYFEHRYPHYYPRYELEKWVWADNPDWEQCPRALQFICLRQLSFYRWVFGKTNGRPHWLPAMKDLYPTKLGKAILNMARPDLGDRPNEPLKLVNDAVRHLYRLIGLDMTKKFKVPFTMQNLRDSYMGSSSGLHKGQTGNLKIGELNVKINPYGKKIDLLESDLDAMINWLRGGPEPSVYWTATPKSEIFFDFIKQMNDEEWYKFRDKLRLFIIPSSIFVLLEKTVSQLRHLRERGRVIRVGHRWPRGGADTLAKCLGIEEFQAFLKLLVEGDVKKFDQSVHEAFVDAYFSTLLIHHDTTHPDFPIFEKIVKFLLKNILVRVTRLFGDTWAEIRGQVPSGCFNTSHMDSWIMGLYIMLFSVYQVATSPEDIRDELEDYFIDNILLIVYGDDFLYKKGDGQYAHYFSGANFQSFMQKFFNVEVRDLYDGVPFCSNVTKDGWLKDRGATFLRHQIILNPNKESGQSTYLPYRESREILVRAIISREGRMRDIVDVVLSCKGLAYATYAANKDAYERLSYLYWELQKMAKASGKDMSDRIQERVTERTMRSFRMMGVSMEEMLSGFPTWDVLVQKNVVDEEYQDISLPGYNYDPTDNMVELDEFDMDY